MSKLLCTCGNILFDQTDSISYKGHFIADQDYYNLFDEMEGKNWQERTSIATNYFREIFQCDKCNTIIFLTNDARFDFSPLDKERSSNLLSSFLKDKWKGTISANFRENKGEIYWYTNKESGFIQDMALADLKETYYKKFEELTKLGILKESFLRIGNRIEHHFDGK